MFYYTIIHALSGQQEVCSRGFAGAAFDRRDYSHAARGHLGLHELREDVDALAHPLLQVGRHGLARHTLEAGQLGLVLLRRLGLHLLDEGDLLLAAGVGGGDLAEDLQRLLGWAAGEGGVLLNRHNNASHKSDMTTHSQQKLAQFIMKPNVSYS